MEALHACGGAETTCSLHTPIRPGKQNDQPFLSDLESSLIEMRKCIHFAVSSDGYDSVAAFKQVTTAKQKAERNAILYLTKKNITGI